MPHQQPFIPFLPICHACGTPSACLTTHPLQDPTGEAAAAAQKHLTYYELDLGLNHVLRKWSDPVDNGANLLIPVPGSGDGPGGVLVCAENFLLYRHQVGGRTGSSSSSSSSRSRSARW
jgi:hypothetical protein